VAAGAAELDELDAIVELPVFGAGHVDVLTGISLHGGDPDAWPGTSVTAALTCASLAERWGRCGLPAYVQLDNDTRFLGSHGRPDILGSVPLFALECGVTPIFAPLRELGFQAGIEGFNALWQARVYRRTFGSDLAGLRDVSDRFVAALRERRAARIEGAPAREPMPAGGRPRDRRGMLIFLRRTTVAGEIDILGRRYLVDRAWAHRLVRAELDLDALVIRAFALRRRDPGHQPLLAELPYRLPDRRAWVARIY
jgi:hypothetical protein